MSRENWCREKSRLLKTADNRIPILCDIKEYVSNLPQEDAKETSTLLHLPLVFDCLNDSNNDQIELTCEVLTICLNSLDLGESTARFYTDLGRALNHPHPSVKSMALKEILRDTHYIPQKLDLQNYETLLELIIKCIGDEHLSVASIACEIITKVGKTPEGLDILCSSEIQPIFNKVMATNEIVRMRFFNIIITIANYSQNAVDKLDQAGFFLPILKDMENPDILVQLNIIELLSVLAATDHGYQYLENHGIMDKLCESLQDDDNSIYIHLCEPGILKFFGHVAHHKPNVIIEKHPFILNRLFSNLHSTDNTILGVSLNTLSYIVDKDNSKLTIDKFGINLYRSIAKIVEDLGVYPNDVKVKALHCLANFLNVNSNNRKVTDITKKWYGYMLDNPMEWIMRYATNPFSELRTGGLIIINSLAKQYWGHEVIRNTPGLIEFLLDRNVEKIKEVKELKYEIVKQLADSPAFNNEMHRSIQKFIKEGPFYVQGIVEIALEGQD